MGGMMSGVGAVERFRRRALLEEGALNRRGRESGQERYGNRRASPETQTL
jgi:hypothetical protein